MHWKLFNINDFLITLLFQITATYWLFSWHVISTSPPPQRTSQLDYPVVLHVAQSHEAFPEDCPIGAVVFPSPVPSVGLWFSVELLRLSNISATPKTHNVALALSVCQCGSSTAAAWMWRSVHFAEHKFPFSSKVLQTGLRIGKRSKKWW